MTLSHAQAKVPSRFDSTCRSQLTPTSSISLVAILIVVVVVVGRRWQLMHRDDICQPWR